MYSLVGFKGQPFFCLASVIEDQNSLLLKIPDLDRYAHHFRRFKESKLSGKQGINQ